MHRDNDGKAGAPSVSHDAERGRAVVPQCCGSSREPALPCCIKSQLPHELGDPPVLRNIAGDAAFCLTVSRAPPDGEPYPDFSSGYSYVNRLSRLIGSEADREAEDFLSGPVREIPDALSLGPVTVLDHHLREGIPDVRERGADLVWQRSGESPFRYPAALGIRDADEPDHCLREILLRILSEQEDGGVPRPLLTWKPFQKIKIIRELPERFLS